jgi:hypothetical protein
MTMARQMILTTGAVAALVMAALVPMAEAVTQLSPPTGTPTAAAPMIRVAEKVTIAAPETVDPGASVTVMISGAAAGGRIELSGPVTQTTKGGQIDSAVDTGGSAQLTAPTAAGTYELRYLNAANAVLARTSLDVSAVPVTLSAPRGLGAGIDTAIEWRGPANPGDMLQVYDPATAAVLAETPAEGQPGAVNITNLRGPESLGDYQIRYWSGANQVVLRSLPVTVTNGDAWLRTPIEVNVGDTFSVEWYGPTDADHVYQIVDPQTGTVVTSQPGTGAGSANLKAPAKAGAYRIQLINSATGFALSDLPLDVDRK